jgi:hypothetical protein
MDSKITHGLLRNGQKTKGDKMPDLQLRVHASYTAENGMARADPQFSLSAMSLFLL